MSFEQKYLKYKKKYLELKKKYNQNGGESVVGEKYLLTLLEATISYINGALDTSPIVTIKAKGPIPNGSSRIQGIVSSNYSSKLDSTGFKTINREETSRLMNNTIKLMKIAEFLNHIALRHLDNTITVPDARMRAGTFKLYRKIHFPENQLGNLQQPISQIIPMSTTLRPDFALGWLGNPPIGEVTVIYEFNVPYIGNYIPLASLHLDKLKPESKQLLENGSKLNQNQFEVTLMPCMIIPTNLEPMHQNNKLIAYKLSAGIEFFNIDQVKQLGNQVHNRNTLIFGTSNTTLSYPN